MRYAIFELPAPPTSLSQHVRLAAALGLPIPRARCADVAPACGLSALLRTVAIPAIARTTDADSRLALDAMEQALDATEVDGGHAVEHASDASEMGTRPSSYGEFLEPDSEGLT